MRLVIASLLLLLLLVLQYQLWFGPASMPDAWGMAHRVDTQRQEDATLQQRNQALSAEVKDLKEGREAIEERARADLGMIKPGETFYLIVQPPEASTPPARPAAPKTDSGGAAQGPVR